MDDKSFGGVGARLRATLRLPHFIFVILPCEGVFTYGMHTSLTMLFRMIKWM